VEAKGTSALAYRHRNRQLSEFGVSSQMTVGERKNSQLDKMRIVHPDVHKKNPLAPL